MFAFLIWLLSDEGLGSYGLVYKALSQKVESIPSNEDHFPNRLAYLNMDVFSAQSPVNFGFPSVKLFSLPPSQPHKPVPRPPPSVPSHVLASSLFQQIPIDPSLFYTSLDIKFVLAFTAIYVTTVLYLNQFNASRQHRPWRFTNTSTFRALVAVHNGLLALFSAWTFCSLFTILLPLWDVAVANSGPNYYAHVAELLCETDSNAYRGTVLTLKLANVTF